MKQSTLSTDFPKPQYFPVSSKSGNTKHTYFNKGVTNPQKAAPENKRLLRSERARARLKTKTKLVALATELKAGKLAAKLSKCSSMRNFLTCGRHEHRKLISVRCQFRLCPYCAERRSRELFKQYLPIVLAFLLNNRASAVHLVLTQPQKENESAKQSRERLMKAFGKLTRRGFFKEHFKGGIWSVEPKLAKHKDGVYHTHLHILAFRTKQFSIKTGNNPLGDLWKAVGGGENFYLRPITDIERGLKEVLKYVAKPLDIDRFTSDNLREFLQMKGARFIDTFGEFRKFSSSFEVDETEDDAELINHDLVEGAPCPDCSQPLFEMYMDEKQYIKFLESLEAMPTGSPPGKVTTSRTKTKKEQ
jgi:plasmid rolling circle replication initiator protein Rep